MLQRSKSCFAFALVALVSLGGCKPAEAPAAAEGTSEGSAASSAGASAVAGTHRIDATVEIVDGKPVLVATVLPGPGYHCNVDYPRWGVEVAADAPVAAGTVLAKADAAQFAEDRVVYRIPLVDAGANGNVAANVRLSICNDETCLTPPPEPIQWTLAAAN